MCEKNGTFNQKPHGCVSFASKYRLSQAHFAACHALASSYKSEKHPGKWSGIVSYMLSSTFNGKYFVFCLYSNRPFTHVD